MMVVYSASWYFLGCCLDGPFRPFRTLLLNSFSRGCSKLIKFIIPWRRIFLSLIDHLVSFLALLTLSQVKSGMKWKWKWVPVGNLQFVVLAIHLSYKFGQSYDLFAIDSDSGWRLIQKYCHWMKFMNRGHDGLWLCKDNKHAFERERGWFVGSSEVRITNRQIVTSSVYGMRILVPPVWWGLLSIVLLSAERGDEILIRPCKWSTEGRKRREGRSIEDWEYRYFIMVQLTNWQNQRLEIPKESNNNQKFIRDDEGLNDDMTGTQLGGSLASDDLTLLPADWRNSI